MLSNIAVASLNASTYKSSATRHFARCRLVAKHFDERAESGASMCALGVSLAAALPDDFLNILQSGVVGPSVSSAHIQFFVHCSGDMADHADETRFG